MRVEVEGLVLDYRSPSGPERALDGLDLLVPSGASLALVGPSGCGKTSLLRVLGGLFAPSAGRVLLDGEPLAGPRAGTATVFQDQGLFPWKTALDNAALGLLASGRPRAEARERAFAALSRLGLSAQVGKYPAFLSGGQRQRVAIARVLALEPRLVLLDEPSSSLDALSKEAFQRELLESFGGGGTTMVLVTHDVEEAAYLCGRIGLMEAGRLVRSLDNPGGGDPAYRERLEYWKFCMGLRAMVREGRP